MMDDIVAFIEAAAHESPGLRAWQAAIALSYLEDGNDGTARLLLPIITDELEHAARDFSWTVNLAAVIEIAARLGDKPSVARAASLLQPFTGQLVVVGSGIYVHGAVDRFLAIAAGIAGRADEARNLFEAAVALEERVQSLPLAARTKYWQARQLSRSPSSRDKARSEQLLDEVINDSERRGQYGLSRLARRHS